MLSSQTTISLIELTKKPTTAINQPTNKYRVLEFHDWYNCSLGLLYRKAKLPTWDLNYCNLM